MREPLSPLEAKGKNTARIPIRANHNKKEKRKKGERKKGADTNKRDSMYY